MVQRMVSYSQTRCSAHIYFSYPDGSVLKSPKSGNLWDVSERNENLCRAKEKMNRKGSEEVQFVVPFFRHWHASPGNFLPHGQKSST